MKQVDPKAKALLQFHILTLVKEGITSINQLLDRVASESKIFEQRLFYPALSGLDRSNKLCWHWKYSETAPPEKHFFLTSEGEKILSNQMVMS